MTATKPPTRKAIRSLPREGMLATVRNRRALVVSVEPFDGPGGRLHLVGLEYTDGSQREDKVIWERELNAGLLEPAAMPEVERQPPMPGLEFDALQRASRWMALSPFLRLGQQQPREPLPFSAPFFGAVQIEDFQLVPLYKALNSSRISLLLADDVGLGKTVEAGLILSELLLRRRVRRVLILCPAALRRQWQQEMKTKFSISFDVIDRPETHALQRRLGMDANPWRLYPRIITSYHYLRQADVLEQFRTTLQQPPNSTSLPWDLLIVDEAHNLMPANFGEDSELSKMLRLLCPHFEHKLFLTATPHNGRTRCFSGLLAMLDPVRFLQTGEMDGAQQRRVSEVLVRRLKREINRQDEERGEFPRFCERIPEPVQLFFEKAERQLSRAFGEFRTGVKKAIASSGRADQLAGSFAVEVLNKRLLSCPYTFARSWYRFGEGIAEDERVDASQVRAAQQAIAQDLDDDLEVEGRLQYGAKTAGAWLKPLVPLLVEEIKAVDGALQGLGLVPDEEGNLAAPAADERYSRLLGVIKKYLRNGPQWRESERLVVFTEYKTTLDYLQERLGEEFKQDPGAVRLLYGGMKDGDRELVKQAFNDPEDPVKILLATDAASEGLNLQETARLILHYDIPWNPARLDQRNGRLDRHGQSQDVIVFHFTSNDDADLRFLGLVVEKINTIREELGSMGEVFDAAFQRRFGELEETELVAQKLEAAVAGRRGRGWLENEEDGEEAAEFATALEEFKGELDLTPETLRTTLEVAMSLQGFGLPRFEGSPPAPLEKGGEDGAPPAPLGKGGATRVRLRLPIPPSWEPLVDDYLRVDDGGSARGSLPAVVFDPNYFLRQQNQRRVFRSDRDTVLLHLGHPLLARALAVFARARFPGAADGLEVSRWTVRYGEVPEGADGLVLLTVEELAVNELRESFHHWVRTLRFVVKDEELGPLLPHFPPEGNKGNRQDACSTGEAVTRARELWDGVRLEVGDRLAAITEELNRDLLVVLSKEKDKGLAAAKERFDSRIAEVKNALKTTTLKKLEKERDELLTEIEENPFLFPEFEREAKEKLLNLEEELERRKGQYQELLDFLKEEKERNLNLLIPKRYTLRGGVNVFPVTVEIRLPEVSR